MDELIYTSAAPGFPPGPAGNKARIQANKTTRRLQAAADLQMSRDFVSIPNTGKHIADRIAVAYFVNRGAAAG